MFEYQAPFTRYKLDSVLTINDSSTGKSKNSMSRLNAVQERQYKKHRSDGYDVSRA